MLTFSDITEAHDRIRAYVHRTPVITSSTIDNIVGRKVFFKCENFQKTGSFKARGAINAVLNLVTNQSERRATHPGVVAYSSGNHGQAMAWAAQIAGIPCTVVLPKSTPAVKVDAIREYGADIVHCQPTPQSRQEISQKIAKERNHTFIPTANHYDVIAGQGTMAVEFLEQVPDLDAILVPTAGGGMASGVSIATKHIKPSTKIFCVEPSGKDLERSLKAGRPLWPEPPQFVNTIAEGIRIQPLCSLAFSSVCQHAESHVFTVTDDEMIHAMKFAMERMKVVVEISAAAGIAAVMSDQMKKMDKDITNVGVILSGGNIDLDALPWLQ